MTAERPRPLLPEDPRDVHLLHLPMGIFVADPDGQLVVCNETARRILGLPEGGVADVHIGELHADPAWYRERARAALDAALAGDGFEKAVGHLRIGGDDVYVEEILRAVVDESSGGAAAIVGCLVDVTAEHEAAEQSRALRLKVEELAFDIGRILHANTSTLLMVNQTLEAVSHALEPASAARVALASADERLHELAQALARRLERLLAVTDPERRAAALPAEAWAHLEEQVAMLNEYQARIPVPELRGSTLRTVASAVGVAVREAQHGPLPREATRDVVRAADDLQRAACLAQVLATRQAVVQMDTTLRALRDFITSDVRAREPRRRIPVQQLVRDAVAQIGEFAKVAGVALQSQAIDPDLGVFGSERELVRALANVLHNAIKYSWRRDRGQPWVAIACSGEGDSVQIEVENWGVPISADEIARGLVFELGYRGKWSTDRGRLGTGIGLTDALRTARAHGGDVVLASRPARLDPLPESHREYHRQPFLTRVTLRLPLSPARSR
jgi:PAS domain S-box-containing protein